MASTTVAGLTELAGRLEQQLSNQASYRSIVTRILLRTGVNIREPKSDQNGDPALVAKVTGVLGEMGYRF